MQRFPTAVFGTESKIIEDLGLIQRLLEPCQKLDTGDPFHTNQKKKKSYLCLLLTQFLKTSELLEAVITGMQLLCYHSLYVVNKIFLTKLSSFSVVCVKLDDSYSRESQCTNHS